MFGVIELPALQYISKLRHYFSPILIITEHLVFSSVPKSYFLKILGTRHNLWGSPSSIFPPHHQVKRKKLQEGFKTLEGGTSNLTDET